MAANHTLIREGIGLLAIGIEDKHEFIMNLLKFYASKDFERIEEYKSWLRQNTPLLGVMTNEDRLRALKDARREFNESQSE
jgi:hypothetical protein